MNQHLGIEAVGERAETGHVQQMQPGQRIEIEGVMALHNFQ